jgi:hypothetical protein
MATYYVKNTGSDLLTGLSDAQAWATISKVNSTTFAPGDTICFNKGDTFRGLLSVTASGTSGSKITYTSYGTGNRPKILGSVKGIGWENQGGNIWKSATSVTNPDTYSFYTRGSSDVGGVEVFFENTDGTVSWGIYKSTTASLTAEYNWCYSGGYIYVYAATDPDTRYSSVEIPQAYFVVDLNYKQYITLSGLDIRYCGYADIQFDESDASMTDMVGIIIDDCEISCVGTKNSGAAYGTQVVGDDLTIKNCTFHDCGRRAISFHIYGTVTASNMIVEDNYFYNGFHTTGVDISVGNGSGMHIDGLIIRRNKFYDPPESTAYAHQIFVQNWHWADPTLSSITNLYIYSNIFVSPPNGCGINMEGAQSVYIFNNTFYNHNNSGSEAHIWIDHDNDIIQIKNNIFYTTYTGDARGVELFIRAYGRDLSNQIADYNAYYRINNSLRVVENENVAMYYMNTLAALRTALGWESHGYFVDPVFTDAANGDFTLQSSSTVKTAGTPLASVALDYNGDPFDGTTPSMGAIQYGDVVITTPTVTTTSISGIDSTVANGGGNVTATGGATVTARGICWSTSIFPTTSDSHTSNGTGMGVFTSTLSGLSADTFYYVRAYATNSEGTSYGENVTFTTLSEGEEPSMSNIFIMTFGIL